MKATIITIGDEILIGQIVDTNSAWISARLNEIGVEIAYKCSVGDTSQAIIEAITQGISRSSVTIITGGLGPTKDDITKHTLARIFNSPLKVDQPTYLLIKDMLKARGVDFNQLNQAQALVPECCTVLPNHNGTAPGMWFENGDSVVVALPGVPFEMKALMNEQVVPMLKRRFELTAIVHRTILTFGLAESVLAQTIAEWESALPDFLRLAYLPNPSGIRLRLSAYDVNQAQANAEIDKQLSALNTIIPYYIIGSAAQSVAEEVANLLTSQGKTLAVAESCTGGAVSSKFTAMAGASAYFLGGVVSYSNEVKINVLGVSSNDLEQYGAVSRQVAEQMALGVRGLCKSDYAIATTGIAGPDGGSESKPVGTVWMAIATPNGVMVQKMVYGKLREQNIERSAVTAINMLRMIVLGYKNVPTTQGIL